MVEADVGVVDGGGGFQVAAAVAADQHTDQVGHVLVGAGEPVLQGEEVGADVLGGAGNEAHQLGQALEHLHLRLAVGADAAGLAVAFLGAAELFQHRERAGGFFHHVEATEFGQAGDLVGRHAAEHGVAILAPGGQGGLDGADVIFEEEHRGDDDVAGADVGETFVEGLLVGAPFVGGVDDEAEAGEFALEGGFGAGDGAGQMAVHRDDDDPDGCGGQGGGGRGEIENLSAHSELLHHRACPP